MIALWHAGVREIVLDREALVIEHDAEFPGDYDGHGAVRRRIACRRLLHREADGGGPSAISVVLVRRELSDRVDCAELLDHPYCESLIYFEAQDGVDVLAILASNDGAPGPAADVPRREDLVCRELLGVGCATAEYHVDDNVGTLGVLTDFGHTFQKA